MVFKIVSFAKQKPNWEANTDLSCSIFPEMRIKKQKLGGKKANRVKFENYNKMV